MAIPIPILAAIISAAGTIGGAAISGSKGQEIGMTGTDPMMDEERRKLMALVMSRI